MLVFEESGKPEYLEKNLSSKDENQQQSPPTYDAESGNQTRATLVGSECSHHCAIPGPLSVDKSSCLTTFFRNTVYHAGQEVLHEILSIANQRKVLCQ